MTLKVLTHHHLDIDGAYCAQKYQRYDNFIIVWDMTGQCLDDTRLKAGSNGELMVFT